MDFVVCPEDGDRLRVAAANRGQPGEPLLMTCPTCSRKFKLSGGRAVEVTADPPT